MPQRKKTKKNKKENRQGAHRMKKEQEKSLKPPTWSFKVGVVPGEIAAQSDLFC